MAIYVVVLDEKRVRPNEIIMEWAYDMNNN